MDNLDETASVIAASKVTGTNVYNTDGDHLGEIYDIMLEKRSGNIAYAVMSFGGFLGIGDKHYPLPWSMLKYDTRVGGYVVNLDKKVLEGAPSYGPRDRIDWDDQKWGRRVHDYYGSAPYF